MRTSLRMSLTAALLSSTAAFAQDNPEVGGAPMYADRTIVENAVNSADHTTLVAAVQAAGLAETLSGPGPFTVFAPTNAAFEALPAGTVDTLLLPENAEMLTQVLTCHVVGTEAFSTDIVGMIEAGGGTHAIETLGGCVINASMNEAGDGITLTDENGTVANVTIADVDQSNGVIHVIDAVLTPAAAEDAAATGDAAAGETAAAEGAAAGEAASGDMAAEDMATEDMAAEDMATEDMATEDMAADDAAAGDAATGDAAAGDMAMDTGGNPEVGGAPMYPTMNIVENAVNSADHTTLVAAVQAAGLAETLSGEGPFTVFAPVNAAFEALPAGTVDTLLLPENRDQLVKVLTAHVVPGRLTAADLAAQADAEGFVHLQTVSGDALSVQVRGSGTAYVFDESGNAFRVTIPDVMQSNGVIHVVDGVLLPE